MSMRRLEVSANPASVEPHLLNCLQEPMGAPMDAEFYRRLARRCRELGSRAAREEVRDHLDLIAADLEAQSDAAEGELQDTADRSTPAYDPKTDPPRVPPRRDPHHRSQPAE